MTRPDGTPPPPAEAPRITADDTTRVPTTPSNDPPAEDPTTPVPKAEPGPLTDVGPRPRTEPWSEHFASTRDRDDDYSPEAIDRDQAEAEAEEDPEKGHPT